MIQKVGRYLAVPFEWMDKNGELRKNSFFIYIPALEANYFQEVPLRGENLFGVDMKQVLKEMRDHE